MLDGLLEKLEEGVVLDDWRANDIMHAEIISNGMGSQSMMMLVLAAEGRLSARLSITGDTGTENDCVWNTGERTTAYEYFDRVIEPYAHEHGIEAIMIRSLDRHCRPLPAIGNILISGKTAGVPFYGSNGGQLPQACTSKYKIRAVRQELRRRGATSARVALGLTVAEVHRMKPSDVKWCENWWPLINLRLQRWQCQQELTKRGISYLISTQCDICPHKDLPRWRRTAPWVIEMASEIENKLDGLFFTPRCVPIKQALNDGGQLSMFDGCDSGGYCMV